MKTTFLMLGMKYKYNIFILERKREYKILIQT